MAVRKERGVDEEVVGRTTELTGWSLLTRSCARSWYNVNGKKELFSSYMRSGTETRCTWSTGESIQ